MNIHVDKNQENKRQSEANSVSLKLGVSESTFQFVDNRPEAVAQRKLQEMVNNSPQARQLRAFQEMANNSPRAKQATQLQTMGNNSPIQRKWSGEIEAALNDSAVLDNLRQRGYSGPKLVEWRIKQLRESNTPYPSYESIASELSLARVAEAEPEQATSTPEVAYQHQAVPPPVSVAELEILSTQPAANLPSQRVPVVRAPAVHDAAADREQPPIEMSEEARHVMTVYENGRLLVTAVQRKDLHHMHNAEARARVSEHLGEGQINMGQDDANTGGPLEYAKVNWTLTSPRMMPHYFKMINDEDRTPKPEPAFDNPIVAPRIATLADPQRMGRRFMRGKDGREDLSEWMEDQSSSKTAGVRDQAPLLDFENPLVSGMFQQIKEHQERTKTDKNPEINTFGFPPEAVVGFLVAGNAARNQPVLEKAKLAMGQADRRIPVFTWRATGNDETPWALVLISYV